MSTVASMLVQLGVNVAPFQQGISQATSTLDKFKVGVGIGLAAAATAAAAGLKASVDAAANFEQQMSQASAVLGATQGELKQLSNLALEMGAKTSFSASQAAEAIEQLGSAGFSASEIIGGGLEGALNLAAASGMKDLGQAAIVAARSVKTFGLEASDLGDVADIIAGAANGAALNVNYFEQALSSGGGVAKQFGFDLREFAAVMMSASESIATGSDAGTSLKSALLNAANPAEKTAKEMQRLGFSIYDTSGNMKSLEEIVANMQKSFSGLTEQQRNSAAAMIFGSDGIRIFNALMKDGVEGLRERRAFLEDSEAAEKAAAERLNNLKGAQEQLNGALESVAINIGQMFLPRLTEMTKGLTEVVARANAFVTGFKLMWSATKGGEEALEKFKKQFPDVYQALQTVLPYFAKVNNAFNALRDAAFKAFDQYIKPLLKELGPLFQSAFAFARSAWENVLRPALIALAPVAQAAFGAIMTIVQTAIRVVRGLFDTLAKFLNGDFRGAWESLKGVIGTALNGILDAVKQVLPSLLKLGGDIVRGIIDGVKNAAGALLGAVGDLARNAINAAKKALGIASPSRVAADEIGKPFVQGVAAGMGDLTPVQQQAVRLRQALVDATEAGNIPRIIQLRSEIERFKGAGKTQAAAMQAATSAIQLHSNAIDVAARKAAAWNAYVGDNKHSAWTNSLKNATDAQLKNALQVAAASQNVERHRALIEELQRREELRASKLEAQIEAQKRWNDALMAGAAAVGDRRYADGIAATIDAVQRSYGPFRNASDALDKLGRAGITLTVPMLDELEKRFPVVAAEAKPVAETAESIAKNMMLADKAGEDLRMSLDNVNAGLIENARTAMLADKALEEWTDTAANAAKNLYLLDKTGEDWVDRAALIEQGFVEQARSLMIADKALEEWTNTALVAAQNLFLLDKAGEEWNETIDRSAQNLMLLDKAGEDWIDRQALINAGLVEQAKNLLIADKALEQWTDTTLIAAQNLFLLDKAGEEWIDTAALAEAANVDYAKSLALVQKQSEFWSDVDEANAILLDQAKSAYAASKAVEDWGNSAKAASVNAGEMTSSINSLTGALNAGKDVFKLLSDLGVEGADGVASLAEGIAKLIGGDIIGGIAAILAPFKDVIAPILKPLGPVFKQLLDAVKPLIVPIVRLAAVFIPLIALILNVISPVLESFGNLLTAIVDFVTNVINGFIRAYNATLGRLFGAIPEIGQSDNATGGTPNNPNNSPPTNDPVQTAPAAAFGSAVNRFSDTVERLINEGIGVNVATPASSDLGYALRGM